MTVDFMKRIFCSGPLPLPWKFCLAYFFVSSRKSTGSLDPVKLGGGGGGGGSAGNNRGGGPTPGKETKSCVSLLQPLSLSIVIQLTIIYFLCLHIWHYEASEKIFAKKFLEYF